MEYEFIHDWLFWPIIVLAYAWDAYKMKKVSFTKITGARGESQEYLLSNILMWWALFAALIKMSHKGHGIFPLLSWDSSIGGLVKEELCVWGAAALIHVVVMTRGYVIFHPWHKWQQKKNPHGFLSKHKAWLRPGEYEVLMRASVNQMSNDIASKKDE